MQTGMISLYLTIQTGGSQVCLISTYNETTGTGVMIDNGTHNLAESGLNAMGAVAVLKIGSWLTYAGRVEEHKTGENSFVYNTSTIHFAAPIPTLVIFNEIYCMIHRHPKMTIPSKVQPSPR